MNKLFTIIILMLVGTTFCFSQTTNNTLNCMYNDSISIQLVNTSMVSKKSNQFNLICQIPINQIVEIDTVKMQIFANDNCGNDTAIKGIKLDDHLPDAIKFLDITLGFNIDIEEADLAEGIIRHDTTNPVFTICESKFYINFEVIQMDTTTNNPISSPNYIENAY